MGKLELRVSNVKCGGCASAIQNGLSTLPEIETVEIDIPSGTVLIHGSGLDSKAIQSKLAELGYPVSA